MKEILVTSKGQVTIPKEVREALGITTGTRVKIKTEGASARLTVARRRNVSKVEDGPKIFNYRGPTISFEDMDKAIAKGMTRNLARRRA